MGLVKTGDVEPVGVAAFCIETTAVFAPRCRLPSRFKIIPSQRDLLEKAITIPDHVSKIQGHVVAEPQAAVGSPIWL
jgi:hypothetical protein